MVTGAPVDGSDERRVFSVSASPPVARTLSRVYGVVITVVLLLLGIASLTQGRLVAGVALIAVAVVPALLGTRLTWLTGRRRAGRSDPPAPARGRDVDTGSATLVLDDHGVSVVHARPGEPGPSPGAARLRWADIAAVVASPTPPQVGRPDLLYVRFLPVGPDLAVVDGAGEHLVADGGPVWLVPARGRRTVDAVLAEITRRQPQLKVVDSRRG